VEYADEDDEIVSERIVKANSERVTAGTPDVVGDEVRSIQWPPR
jgi:hypothetical protein